VLKAQDILSFLLFLCESIILIMTIKIRLVEKRRLNSILKIKQ
jgi:hypothetical protein